ncbi:MAG: O-antigen ligase family protein [Pyrinomonadaceae bacterium]|nr:O-antigen ligase family protein [Pyrinomonadaceae bacterium]
MSSVVSTQLTLAPRRAGRISRRASVRDLDWFAFTLLALHIPLALVIHKLPVVSTVHGLILVSLGIYWAARNQPQRVAYAAAYIVGAEVLWRMTKSQVFWEFGKYATSGIFILFLLLSRRRRLAKMPLVYFGLLMPSTVLTILALGNSPELQKALSFYLSGPLALAAAWCFFAQLKLSTNQLQRIFLSLLCPTLSVATVALSTTLTQTDLKFTDESNFATSGGFGPNQVAGALGMGVVFAFLWLLTNKAGWINRIMIFAVLGFLSIQAALTFSRGGLYNAAGSTVLASFYLLRDRRSRGRVIIAVGAILLVAFFVVLPHLENFTGGALSTRFKNVNVANRDTIIRSDLLLWQENPILGVGPAMAALHRRMPHTELTRLLAEHGIFGLTALGILVFSAVQSVRRARGSQGKALAGSMASFSLLFMLDKAMRLAVPSFAFGLSFATVVSDQESRSQSAGNPRALTTTNRRSMLRLARRGVVSSDLGIPSK